MKIATIPAAEISPARGLAATDYIIPPVSADRDVAAAQARLTAARKNMSLVMRNRIRRLAAILSAKKSNDGAEVAIAWTRAAGIDLPPEEKSPYVAHAAIAAMELHKSDLPPAVVAHLRSLLRALAAADEGSNPWPHLAEAARAFAEPGAPWFSIERINLQLDEVLCVG